MPNQFQVTVSAGRETSAAFNDLDGLEIKSVEHHTAGEMIN